MRVWKCIGHNPTILRGDGGQVQRRKDGRWDVYVYVGYRGYEWVATEPSGELAARRAMDEYKRREPNKEER